MILAFDDKVYQNWHLKTNYHFGGFARYTKELIRFVNDFRDRHSIQLDPIYTGNMMYGLYDMIQKDEIKYGTAITAIHTGGIQGINELISVSGI